MLHCPAQVSCLSLKEAFSKDQSEHLSMLTYSCVHGLRSGVHGLRTGMTSNPGPLAHVQPIVSGCDGRGACPQGSFLPTKGLWEGSNLNSQQGLCNVTYHSHSTEAGWLPVAKRCCFLAKTASHSLEQHWPGGLEVLMELLMGLAVLLWQDRSLCLWGLSFLVCKVKCLDCIISNSWVTFLF